MGSNHSTEVPINRAVVVTRSKSCFICARPNGDTTLATDGRNQQMSIDGQRGFILTASLQHCRSYNFKAYHFRINSINEAHTQNMKMSIPSSSRTLLHSSHRALAAASLFLLPPFATSPSISKQISLFFSSIVSRVGVVQSTCGVRTGSRLVMSRLKGCSLVVGSQTVC